MQPKDAGELDPDLDEQFYLWKLWDLSRTAILGDAKHRDVREARLNWVADEFTKEHASKSNVSRDHAYAWMDRSIDFVSRAFETSARKFEMAKSQLFGLNQSSTKRR